MATSTADKGAGTALPERTAIRRTVQLAVGQADLATVAQHMFALMFRNVASDGYAFADPMDPSQFSRPGCIIASPSYHASFPTVDQDYVFNWTRDAAVTAVELAVAELPTSQPLVDYVTFAQTCQNSGPPIGYASYTIEGRHRPNWSEQSDGPALQTLAILQMYAKLDAASQAVAREVVAADIGYLLSVYQRPTKNLWEERDGYSFFARAVQLRCFSELAANSLGIPVPAGVAEAINWLQARLPEHWNSSENIYVTFGGPVGATNPPPTPGYDPNVDIVMACIYGAVPPTDTRMLATAARISSQWTDPASAFAYPINAADKARGVGPLMGRYPDDHYDGDGAPPSDVGHPWVPCTANFAELCYRLATTIRAQQAVPLDSLSAAFFSPLAIDANTQAAHAADLLDAAGDQMLAALIFHSDRLELSEQFDRTTGFEKSVANLTWSYAACLSAVRARTGTVVHG
ncbi:MAG: glycoside hydrolase family 15 protein [Solirubrobacteraceae bacterium]